MERHPPANPAIDLFDEVCRALIVGHGKDEGPVDTLNRVFRKNYALATGSLDFPRLTRADMTVSIESWPTWMLMDLIVRPTSHAPGSIKGIGKKARHYPDTPVVVARFRGRNYLMDGNRRVQYLNELGRPEIKVLACRIS